MASKRNLRLQRRARDGIKYVLTDEHGRILAILAVGWFFTLGIQFTISALLPQIMADLGIDNSAAGAALSFMWLVHELIQFPAGVLSDWVGERRLLFVSLLLTVVSVVLFAARMITYYS